MRMRASTTHKESRKSRPVNNTHDCVGKDRDTKPAHQLTLTAFSLHNVHSQNQRKPPCSHHNAPCEYIQGLIEQHLETPPPGRCRTGAYLNTESGIQHPHPLTDSPPNLRQAARFLLTEGLPGRAVILFPGKVPRVIPQQTSPSSL